MPYVAPTTRTTGEFIDTPDWNQDVVENQNAAFPLGVAGWTTYTPTLSQGVALTKTVTYAKYQRVGRLIVVMVNLAIASAGTAANAITVGLPVTAASASGVLGSFRYLDAGTTVYAGSCYSDGGTATVNLFANANANPFGVAPAVTAASGDQIQIAATYEAAS